MNRQTFNALLKDLIPHLYDYATVETHPLTAAIELPASHHGGRGEYIHKLVIEAIEKLQPPSRTPNLGAPEWRPYLILHQRYVEGLSPQAVAAQLALSERQLRRDHSRALQALAERLYDQIFPAPSKPLAAPTQEEQASAQVFETHLEPLDLMQVLQSVLNTLQARAQAENVHLELHLPETSTLILTDRIILRQVLLSLFNYAFHLQVDHIVQVSAATIDGQPAVDIQAAVDENWAAWDADERQDLLETARRWGEQVHINVQQVCPPCNQAGSLQLRVLLPSAAASTVMVVDDQQPTLHMYQRYLSRTNLKVLGVSDPSQALSLACQAQPILILLDVMMPHVDGWEILQALRTDAQTKHIPVIVCSAWEASELARSLGAANFLKKPITQKDLLTALQQINILAY